jgi:hypothetical protein
LDLLKKDNKKVAYLPAYTCETVIAPYKKAGYALKFYDIDPALLKPRFDRNMISQISVLGLCGYYGFSYYDRSFVEECCAAGVTVLQDITHSIFSKDGIETNAGYNAGSLRKWLGIPSGGVAVKRRGLFSAPLLSAEEEHVKSREACFAEQEKVLKGEEGASEEKVSELFWTGEMRLRQMFDAYESDSLSAEIAASLPFEHIVQRRRANYGYILSRSPFSPAIKPVFPVLEEGVCPSHLALYSPDRETAREALAARGIKSTVYWPFHNELDLTSCPGAAYIYNHIYSLPVDQRWQDDDMDYLCGVLADPAVKGI